MKTKLIVKISINTKSKQAIVSADLLLLKTNWPPGMIRHDMCTSGTSIIELLNKKINFVILD